MTKILKQNSNRHERIELWAVVGQKHQTFWGLRTSFSPHDICKNPRSMCARVPQAMAQFVLKIEKLSHIMGTAPIVELARAHGLHQGVKRPGGETGSPLLVPCVMRRRTGTSARSALPVRLMGAKNFLSTNRKSTFLSL